jgi:hypothetical protein
MAESYFGHRATNDWKLVAQLRAGRRLWSATEARIRAFMETYQPAPRGRRSHRSTTDTSGRV